MKQIDLPEGAQRTDDEVLYGDDAISDDFDVQAALTAADPIIDHYLAKVAPPGDHLEDYDSPDAKYNSRTMNTRALRPTPKGLAILVTEQLAYHAAVATWFNALQLAVYRGSYNASQASFDKLKKQIREDVWHNVTAGKDLGELKHLHTVKYPKLVPKLPPNSFAGVELPAGAKIVPALISLPLPTGQTIETDAAVVFDSDDNERPEHMKLCLIKFRDYTGITRYAVSEGAPIQTGYFTNAPKIFDSIDEALAVWNPVRSQESSQSAEKKRQRSPTPDQSPTEAERVFIKQGGYSLQENPAQVSGLLKHVEYKDQNSKEIASILVHQDGANSKNIVRLPAHQIPGDITQKILDGTNAIDSRLSFKPENQINKKSTLKR